MSFDFPTEEKIAESLTGCVSTSDSIHDFLISDFEVKDPTNRLISWMVTLNIIDSDPSTFAHSLFVLNNEYNKLVNEHINENSVTRGENQISIFKDLRRTIHWLVQISEDFEFKEDEFKDGIDRLTRVFTLFNIQKSDFHYLQGLDRYGSVCLIMASLYTKKSGFSMDFAESLTFYLTRAILDTVPFIKTFSQQSAIRDHFQKLDMILQEHLPSVYNVMVEGDCSTVFFGCRWEYLMFADEHSGSEILRIWDQIFARLPIIDKFIPCLTIAHLSQISFPEECLSVNEVVLHWRQWDISQMINDAKTILYHRKTGCQRCCTSFFCCCPRLHGFQFLPSSEQ